MTFEIPAWILIKKNDKRHIVAYFRLACFPIWQFFVHTPVPIQSTGVFQMVFQENIKLAIPPYCQQDRYSIQLTPAHHIRSTTKTRLVRVLLFLGS